jgi:hypothetical protein
VNIRSSCANLSTKVCVRRCGGRFDGAELVHALGVLPNGTARTWSREPNEPANIFAGRIIRDVIEAARGQCVGVLVALEKRGQENGRLRLGAFGD